MIYQEDWPITVGPIRVAGARAGLRVASRSNLAYLVNPRCHPRAKPKLDQWLPGRLPACSLAP